MKMQSKEKKRKKENCFNFSFKYLWSVDMNLIKNHVGGAETNDSSLSNSGAVFTKIL